MSIRHTCQGPPQQSPTSNCVACDLSGVGTGQTTANYGQAHGPQIGVGAQGYVQPPGHAVHSDVAWFNQTLSSAPRNAFSWSEEPPNDRYGVQGGTTPPAPGYPYPTSITLPGGRVTAPPAGGGPRQPTQNPPVVGQQYHPELGQNQQRQPSTNPQSRQQEEAVAPSNQGSKGRYLAHRPIFAPLKVAYRDAVERLERGGVNAIGKENFTFLYSSARNTAFTKKNILSGWCKGGLYPLNPNEC
ncbi:hypothetical protein KC316_g7455 [Hortaea werneckii]|nr:hypothetical protein KC324_g7459 [Hortaea werneckii]KAI7583138.1 hypothetical protein KC316_g7455 [Hortaea werneckii]